MTTPQSGVERREFDALERRFGDTDRNVQTLTGLVNSLAQAQALFEYKTEQAKRVSEKLETLVDKINERGDAQLARVEGMLDDREERMNKSMQSHKEVLLLEIANKTATAGQLDGRVKQVEDDIKAMNKIIWMAMGGAAVISFLAEKLFSIIT